MAEDTRTERDSMGDVKVPADAMYGAQTQRAVNNFQLSSRRMPASFIRRLAQVKGAAATANRTLGLLPDDLATAIIKAADAIAAGGHGDQFPYYYYYYFHHHHHYHHNDPEPQQSSHRLRTHHSTTAERM